MPANAPQGGPQPPATLVLSGELKHQRKCLGVYALEAGRTAHGRAVWRHERGGICIAKTSSGNWVVQGEANVGVNNNGVLRLRDANAAFPHLSDGAWGEFSAVVGWQAAAGLKCTADPPPAQEPPRAAGKRKACDDADEGDCVVVEDRGAGAAGGGGGGAARGRGASRRRMTGSEPVHGGCAHM